MAKSDKVGGGAYERRALAFDSVIYLGFRALFLNLGKALPLIVSRGHRVRLVGKSMTGLKLMSRYLRGRGWNVTLHCRGGRTAGHLRLGKKTPKSSGSLVMLLESSDRKLQPRQDRTCKTP